MENNKEKFLVIDGNSIMNRAFYGIRLLSTNDGLYTNAIYGFLNIYYMMIDKLNPDYVAVAFDLKAPTFRHKMYTEYKAHRKMMPDELRVQMPVIKEILSAMNVPIFEIEGYEADDILGTLSNINTKNNIFTYILTGDKDSLQLISDNTSIVMPITKMGKTEYTIYTPDVLMEKQNIIPKQIIDIKSLMGDSSDNIPGVPGIGEKTAYSLICNYESLEKIYENLDMLDITKKVKEKLEINKDMAFLSYTLATIDINVPIDLDYEKVRLSDVDLPKLTSLFNRLSFKKFLERYNVLNGDIAETKTNTDFFRDYDPQDVIDINKEYDVCKKYILEKESEDISVAIINSKNMKLHNLLAICASNKYMYLDLENTTINLKELLETLANVSSPKIGYDLKKIFNLCLRCSINNLKSFVSDIKIAYYLLNAHHSNFELENIAYNLLGVNMPTDINDENKDKAEENIQTSLFDIGIEDEKSHETLILTNMQKKYIYAALNCIKQLNPILHEDMAKNNLISLYYEIEMPLIETLADIENNGMYINKEKLLEFGNMLSKDIRELETKIYDIAGETFNINSPQQLGTILFEKLKLPIRKKTKKGYATDKETLDSILDEHKIVKHVLEYRAMTKLMSTYVDGLIDCIGEDGRLHTTFMQTVTATGRLSSVEPNLQNIPVRTELGSKIRDCFEAEGNNIIIDADYSQIELRVLAHMSDDDIMIKAFKDGTDIHKVTASQVFNVPLEEVDHELRSRAKAVNFGIVYGISAFGLAKNINATRYEASEYIDSYLTKYHKVNDFMKNSIEQGKKQGYVTTMFGRIRYTEELKASNKNTVMFGERIAMNTPIQGTAADIIKNAMNVLYTKLKANNLKAKIIMQVHDELIVEAPKDEQEVVVKLMRESMENIIDLKVPLEVSVNTGKTWSEAK